MALVRDLSQAQLAFQVTGGEADQFQVTRYRGNEGLCQLYRFEIELAVAAGEVSFADIVGKPAVLSINAAGGTRWFHGIVGRFEMTGQTHNQVYYRAELVPQVWLLTHRYNSRIFQNKTVADIIADILTKAGITSDRYRMTLEGSYEPREYCVQYRETDYNFICRLMEEEGIWWYFEQSEEGHLLAMADAPSAYSPITGEAALPFHPPTGLNIEEDHVFRFRIGQAVRPGAVALNDFNFENPKLDLKSKSDSGRDTNLEFFDYPGEYLAQSAGTGLAKIRAEEFESGRILAVGSSNCPRLAVGQTFDLIEHPATATNQSYLLTSIVHQGKQSTIRATTGTNGRAGILDARVHQSLAAARQNENGVIRELADALLQIVSRLQTGDPTAHRELTNWLFHAGQVARDPSSAAMATGSSPLDALGIPNLIDDISASVVDLEAPIYECRFQCIPSAVTYRPPRITPWPVMRGTQTARVVGPSGEEIHTDEYGRVKVQFNWDREGKFDENSSCFIRVSQGMAGGGYGMMFLPRIGQEVVVDFLEGDPDKPLIVGRVYNADHMPPYPLPDEKTKSVIKTHSSKGGGGTNEVRFEDLKDKEQILIYAQKDFHLRVKNDRVENVENDQHLEVTNNRIEKIGKDVNWEIGQNLNTKITTDHSLEISGKESVKITGTRSHDVGSDVVDKFGSNHKHDVTATYVLKAMSIKLEAATGIELKCGGSSIVLTPAAIFIVGGPLVNINSGSGPPVGPVTAQATAPTAPEAPIVADEVEPGKDTTYGGGEPLPDATAEPDVPPSKWEGETEEKELTWIEIELVDEADMPVSSEPYELKLPDGKIRKGTLDANGLARVDGIEPGTCQICFPKLDAEAWERI